jgi:hypothetical protein
VRNLNVPAWRAWVICYSAGDLPDGVAVFLVSATCWALHKKAGVDRDIICLRG